MEEKEIIYFVGIGGIGMSALAQLYASQGKKVCGSDRGSSKVTQLLEGKGIEVFIGHDAKNVPQNTTLLIYSDAVPEDNEERVKAHSLGIQELSYFEALGEATKKGTSIVITGTHGKTTTTAMVAKILIDAGKRPTVIAGSILSEYGSNFIEGRNDLYVIEGCEYRRHFLHLHPDILAINNIELDHTDYFKDLSDMQHAFREVIGVLPKNGLIVTNTASKNIQAVLQGEKREVVSFENIYTPVLLAKGRFNVENAQVAKTVALSLFKDLDEEKIDTSLSGFKGTWRRFEYKGTTEKGALVYDDYAHHPTAVRGTIEMAKHEFKDKEVVVVFHPHLYSRTKDFYNEFVEALSLADKTILVPIFAAREKLDSSVDSESLTKSITAFGGNAVYAKDFDTVKKMLLDCDEKYLILTMGAGDVYLVGNELVSPE